MALNVEVDSTPPPADEDTVPPVSVTADSPPAVTVTQLEFGGGAVAVVDVPGSRRARRPLVPIIVESARHPEAAPTLPIDPPPAGAPVRRPTISVIVPTLNEAKNLPFVLPAIPSDVHEVIIVDGRSTDGTVDVARALLPSVRVLLETKAGKGAALRAGFLAATGDIIVMLDADGSADPTEIPRFVDALVAGADFAKGSRFLPGGGSADITRIRAAGNAGLTLLVRLLFGGAYTDLCYGYNAFWRSIEPLRELDVPGFEIETLMNITALRHGLKVTEVPSFEANRIHGVSNLRAIPDGWRVLRTILLERLTFPMSLRGRVTATARWSGRESRDLVPVMIENAGVMAETIE